MPAMQPDYCIKCSSKNNLEKLRNYLQNIKDKDGKQIIIERYSPQNNRLNISLLRSKILVLEEKFIFKGREYSIEEFGFQIIKRDIGTGYHIPEGIFLAMGGNNTRLNKYKNEIIETARICPTILDLLKVEIPKYMIEPL